MEKKNVTFQDIADYTHFSKTTISRYFNNPGSLTPENQEKIAEALQVLGYKKNKVARILASGKTEFIGLIIPNIFLPFYAEVMDQLLQTYEKYGYKFIVFTGSDREEIERQYIEELLAYQIEGLIVLTHTIPSAELASYPIPVVGIEREDRFINSVNTDNYLGGVQAAGLLHKNNCDILIHVNSLTSPDVPAYQRIVGFTDICQEQGIPFDLYIRKFANTFDALKRLMNEITDEIIEKYPGKRKGIFLSNDSAANLMLNHLFNRFGRLPDEYRIVGFDNSPLSREAVIPTSTVGQQVDVLAETAMELLVRQMEERRKRKPSLPEEPVHKIVPPILFPRATSVPEYDNHPTP